MKALPIPEHYDAGSHADKRNDIPVACIWRVHEIIKPFVNAGHNERTEQEQADPYDVGQRAGDPAVQEYCINIAWLLPECEVSNE